VSRDLHAIAPQISQAAAEWFVIMREPVVSEADRAGFSAWLQASPVHVHAYLDMARLWGDTAHLDPELSINEGSALAAGNVVPMPATARTRHAAAEPGDEPAFASPKRKIRRRHYAVAASIALLAGLGSAVTWWQIQQPPTYVTDVGEQRVLTLEDGSIVRLNSRSRVRVRMLPGQRLIELVEGQALFEVAKDPQRPFIVRSGNVAARAIGTQFDVYRKPTGTVVTVVEGLVEVRTEPALRKGSAEATVSMAPVSVKAGEQVTVGRTGLVEQRQDANVNAAMRWLQQELVFDGQTLSAVVEEFNRYQRIPIVLDDQALGEMRVNAVFNTTGPEPLLRFVDRMEEVRVERTPQAIRITRKPSDRQ